MLKKVIVTGANSFVGSAVVKELLKNNIEVLALDMKGCNQNLPESPNLTFLPFSMDKIDDLEMQIVDRDYDTFYHFAWAGVSGSQRSDTQVQLNNAQWSINAIRFAKKIGCHRFVNAGSIMELETIGAVFSPENRPGLGYIYGAGKIAAHAMCKAVAAEIGIDLIWGMITNAYGVGEISPRLVNSTIKKCIAGENPKFTAGTQNYDFVYIDDVADAFYLIGAKGKPFCEYLIGSSQAKPLKEFLLEMQNAIAPDLDFIFGDIPYTGINLPLDLFDCSKTERDTGFRATISFADGCKKTRQWLESMIAK